MYITNEQDILYFDLCVVPQNSQTVRQNMFPPSFETIARKQRSWKQMGGREGLFLDPEDVADALALHNCTKL